MSQEDRRMRISLHLSENQNEVQKQIENCADILFRPLLIGEKEKTEAFLIYIEVAVSNLMLEDSVIGKLLNRLLSMDTKEIYGTLENNSLGISDTKELFTLEEAMEAMFADSGDASDNGDRADDHAAFLGDHLAAGRSDQDRKQRLSGKRCPENGFRKRSARLQRSIF